MTDYVALYICPVRHLTTPLQRETVRSESELEFPITVERCSACQETHVLEKRDVKLSAVPGT